jgi:predicted amidohydrolase
MNGPSPSSVTTDPLTMSSLRGPAFSIAWMMLRALSWLTVVGPAERGPSAVSTASAPDTAGTIAAGSMTSAVMQLSRGSAWTVSLAGSRTTAATS